MANLWSSTTDPLFFMHHGQIDRLWAVWQSYDESRLHDIGGPVRPDGTGIVQLSSSLDLSSFEAPSITARQIMDTVNKDGTGILCYKYEKGRFY